MSTINAVIERLFRTYLTPPDAQYVQFQLSNPVTIDAEEIVVGEFTIAEDENLLRQGSLLEFDSELVRVVSYESTTRVAVVQRAQYGTVAAAYDVPLLVNVNPPYSKQSVFEAIRDNIIQLYPSLYTVGHDSFGSVSGNIFPVNRPLMVEVLEVWPDQAQTDVNIGAQVVDFHPQAGGRAVVTKVSMGTIWVRYRKRMGVAETVDDTLEDLGVEDVWTSAVMAGAAADLMAGRDIPAAHVEWVGQVLEAESIPVGTRTSLSVGLARYRELLVKRFAKEMVAEDANKVQVYMNDPFRQVG